MIRQKVLVASKAWTPVDGYTINVSPTPFGLAKLLDSSRFALMRLRVWHTHILARWVVHSIDIHIQPQSGDVYHFSRTHFGAGATQVLTSQGVGDAGTSRLDVATHGIAGDAASNIITASITLDSRPTALRFAYLVQLSNLSPDIGLFRRWFDC